MFVRDRTISVLLPFVVGVFLAFIISKAQAQKCGGLLPDANNGNLTIEASNSSCLWIIKLQSRTSINLELQNLTMEPVIAIPEQTTATPDLQSVWIVGPKNTYKFEGQFLAILAPPRHHKVSLSWTGMTVDTSEVSLDVKLERNLDEPLQWQQSSVGTDKIFWVIEPESAGQLNWELNSDLPYCGHENPCLCSSFGVVHVMPDGSVHNLNKTCQGSSLGSSKVDKNSKVLILLHMESSVGAGSNLQVTWKPDQRKRMMGVLVGTDGGLYVVTPNPWKKTKVPSKHVRGVSFDWNLKKIYWAEDGVGIMRVNLDGTGFQQLIFDEHAFGMGIEPITGNLYYRSQMSNSLRVCNSDAQKCSTIATRVGTVYDIAFHPSEGLLFWSVDSRKTIRANLDGTNAVEIVKENSYGISVDEAENRLYVGTARSGSGLISCDLNGNHVRTVPDISGDPVDVELNDDKIYYNDCHANRLYVKQGTNLTSIASFKHITRHVTLFGKPLSSSRANPCEFAECTHLCVLITASSYRCLHPDDEDLDKKGQKDGLLTDLGNVTGQCGGFITLDTRQELLYQIPSGVPSVNCIWIIWTNEATPITIKNEPDSKAKFDSSFKLTVAHNFSKKGFDQFELPSGSEKIVQCTSANHKFVVIFFRADTTKSGQGVFLTLEYTGERYYSFYRPDFRQLSLQNTGTFNYPSESSYENNERAFSIGRVPQGKSLSITVNFVNTEKDYDWFQIMWLGTSLYSYRYTDTSYYNAGRHWIPEGCSFIMMFLSDGSNTGAGIRLSYTVN